VRRVLVGIVASLILASPASAAFTAPELFVRLQKAGIEHQPVSDWVPLASAPGFDYIGGFQIGYRLQPTGVNGNFQTAAITILGVPDGQPTQPLNTPPYCVGRNGTAGEITPIGSEIQYEGNGSYTISVSVGGDPPGAGCMTVGSATSSGSFTVDAHTTGELVGRPFAFRAKALPGKPFVGLRAPDPPGGYGDNSCAIDATINPDGSVAGRRVVPADPEPPRQTVTTFPVRRQGPREVQGPPAAHEAGVLRGDRRIRRDAFRAREHRPDPDAAERKQARDPVRQGAQLPALLNGAARVSRSGRLRLAVVGAGARVEVASRCRTPPTRRLDLKRKSASLCVPTCGRPAGLARLEVDLLEGGDLRDPALGYEAGVLGVLVVGVVGCAVRELHRQAVDELVLRADLAQDLEGLDARHHFGQAGGSGEEVGLLVGAGRVDERERDRVANPAGSQGSHGAQAIRGLR
jgi:hypothetical protein